MSLNVALSHAFPGFSLNVTFDAPRGVTVLFGHSGSGKTSVVNAIAGIFRPDTARISIDGDVLVDSARSVVVPVHKRRVGYVFQEARLFPHLNVHQNLRYGRWFNGAKPDPKVESHIVEMLGIGPLLGRHPNRLSGGERQRVSLGRALLADPRILLMDEPLAALDETRKAEILPYLERLRDEAQMPILYVSHSMAEVARLATTVVALDAGQVVRSGPAMDVLSDPEAVPALGVHDAGALLSGHVLAHHPDGLSEIAISAGTLLLPRLGAPIGSPVRVRIEASDVLLSRSAPDGLSALNVLPVTVDALRRGKAGGVILRLRAKEDAFLSRISARAADRLQVAKGQNLFAVIESVSVARRDVGG